MDHVEKFQSGYIRIYKDILYLGDPFVHLALILFSETVLLVCPMSCDTFFCNFIHSGRADLDFNPESGIAHQCAVKSLISVVLRIVHPVADTVSLVSVKTCDDGEYVIALVSFCFLAVYVRVKYDADRIEVIDLVEGNAFVIHLIPDRIRCLDPFLDFVFETGSLEGNIDRSDEISNFLVLVVYVAVDLCRDLIESFRFFVSEPDVFHF